MPQLAGGQAASRGSSTLIVAGALLANGIALLAHIILGFPLAATLGIVWLVALVSVGAILATRDGRSRAELIAIVVIGLAAGLLATAAYDVSKAILSTADPSPYNPFEAVRIFGTVLLGESAPAPAVLVAGWTFHLMNGATFGCAFACLYARFGRGSRRLGLIGGIGWGVFLEAFQLSLYPGWLSIRYLDEFRQISFLSHVVYGAVLGLVVPRALQRWPVR